MLQTIRSCLTVFFFFLFSLLPLSKWKWPEKLEQQARVTPFALLSVGRVPWGAIKVRPVKRKSIPNTSWWEWEGSLEVKRGWEGKLANYLVIRTLIYFRLRILFLLESYEFFYWRAHTRPLENLWNVLSLGLLYWEYPYDPILKFCIFYQVLYFFFNGGASGLKPEGKGEKFKKFLMLKSFQQQGSGCLQQPTQVGFLISLWPSEPTRSDSSVWSQE